MDAMNRDENTGMMESIVKDGEFVLDTFLPKIGGGVHGISLGHYYGKRQCQPYSCRTLCAGQPAISHVHLSRSQINDRGFWFGNETTCAHAYNICH